MKNNKLVVGLVAAAAISAMAAGCGKATTPVGGESRTTMVDGENQESGAQEGQESGAQESQEPGAQESQMSGVQGSQMSGVQEGQESGAQESQEPGARGSQASGGKEPQMFGDEKSQAVEGGESQTTKEGAMAESKGDAENLAAEEVVTLGIFKAEEVIAENERQATFTDEYGNDFIANITEDTQLPETLIKGDTYAVTHTPIMTRSLPGIYPQVSKIEISEDKLGK